MGIGSSLKEILKAEKVSIRELAVKTGISQHTLYSITKRDSKSVERYTLIAICKVLMINASRFIPAISADEAKGINRMVNAWISAEEKEKRALAFNEAMQLYQVEVSSHVRIQRAFAKLNIEGRRIAAERVEELAEIQKYTIPSWHEVFTMDNKVPETPLSPSLEDQQGKSSTTQKKPPEGQINPNDGK